MGKKAVLEIKESVKELERLKKKQKTLGFQKRLMALQHIALKKHDTRNELANYLGVHIRTLERWMAIFKQGGISELLARKPRRKGSKIITKEMHLGLQERLTDPKKSFKGYWDAQRWIKTQYGIDVKYQLLRAYLIKHFETKVKTPRKSHIKKDERAVVLFKNTQKRD